MSPDSDCPGLPAAHIYVRALPSSDLSQESD
jgi:hypothetical protein